MPAGGWTERQAIMENVAAPTATALDICPWPMIQEQSRPEAHDKRCPPTIARGRAASLQAVPSAPYGRHRYRTLGLR